MRVNVTEGNVTHQALRDDHALWEACIERITGTPRWPYEPLAALRSDDPMAAVMAG